MRANQLILGSLIRVTSRIEVYVFPDSSVDFANWRGKLAHKKSHLFEKLMGLCNF